MSEIIKSIMDDEVKSWIINQEHLQESDKVRLTSIVDAMFIPMSGTNVLGGTNEILRNQMELASLVGFLNLKYANEYRDAWATCSVLARDEMTRAGHKITNDSVEQWTRTYYPQIRRPELLNKFGALLVNLLDHRLKLVEQISNNVRQDERIDSKFNQ